MEVKGSEALLKALQQEGVDVVFGYPGGTIMPVYDALYDSSIRHILCRHEQGAVHAAESYAVVTGKVGVVFATSGPGATNLVTGLTDAMMDSRPVVAITGQVARSLIGRDAFQEADVLGITMPCTKHNYQVRDVRDLPRVIKEAFHLARSGRPGPVLVDIPKDVQTSKFEWYYPTEVNLPGYKPTYVGHQGQVDKAAAAIRAAERPVLIAGGGVITSSGATAPLQRLAYQMQAPVAGTLTGLGGFAMDDPLFFGLVGMHGTYAANRAVNASDVLVAIGMRFDDRVTGLVARFAPRAKVVHIDIDPAEISKNVTAHIPIVGDCAIVLGQLLAALGDWQQQPQNAWLDQVLTWQAEHPLWGEKPRRVQELAAAARALRIADARAAFGGDGGGIGSGAVGSAGAAGAAADPGFTGTDFAVVTKPGDEPLKPQEVLMAVQRHFGTEAVICTDVGQHQMWAAHYLLRTQPRTWVSSCGLGTMGFGLPAALGAKVGAPDREVVLITGEGSFQMTLQELGTISSQGLPVKIVLLNNGFLGMVRQWQQLFFQGRYQDVDLRPGMPDFAKLMEAYHLKGERIETFGQLEDAIVRMREHKGAYLLDCRVETEENVYPIVPPGGANVDALMKEEV